VQRGARLAFGVDQVVVIVSRRVSAPCLHPGRTVILSLRRIPARPLRTWSILRGVNRLRHGGNVCLARSPLRRR
jgi:hypothetical protein